MKRLYGWLACGQLHFLVALGLLATSAAWAQAPVWERAVGGYPLSNTTSCIINAVAADAAGNVFVAGNFSGQAMLGSLVLTSAGGGDLFVAKYSPATGTWVWAQRGGGSGPDMGTGIAVSGNNVYVTGHIQNLTGNGMGVSMGGTAPAATGAVTLSGSGNSGAWQNADLLLAKFQDNGTSATLAWTQLGGGTDEDAGNGVAVSGTSVYVTGYLTNSTGNNNAVVFGSDGIVAGTRTVRGATTAASRDMLLAKYTDNGPSATLAWTQVGGGSQGEAGNGVAVSGTSVYVTGYLTNTTTNTFGTVFGGDGTTVGTRVQHGATTQLADSDLLLAKYTDNGSTATFGWSQVAGGTFNDGGYNVAVSGSNVYVVGGLFNDNRNGRAVTFGGSGATAGTQPQYGVYTSGGADLVLAKYTDNGSTGTFGWSQVGGGTGADGGGNLAVSGSSIYVTGFIDNDTNNYKRVVLGGSGAAAGTFSVPGASATASFDMLLAKYTDSGPAATVNWAQVAGGPNTDYSFGVVLSGQRVYIAGYVQAPGTFGTTVITSPVVQPVATLAYVTDTSLTPLPLATAPAVTGISLAVFPNPASGAASLSGALPGQVVRVLDALGREVATATTDAAGMARLAGLAPGLYLVRAGAATARLAVE